MIVKWKKLGGGGGEKGDNSPKSRKSTDLIERRKKWLLKIYRMDWKTESVIKE